jgi:hypothetical protein
MVCIIVNSTLNQFFSFLQTKTASKLIVWSVIFQMHVFENWNLAYPTSGKQPYISEFSEDDHPRLMTHPRDNWWTLDFANVSLSPGVNSRAELVPSPGLTRATALRAVGLGIIYSVHMNFGIDCTYRITHNLNFAGNLLIITLSRRAYIDFKNWQELTTISFIAIIVAVFLSIAKLSYIDAFCEPLTRELILIGGTSIF